MSKFEIVNQNPPVTSWPPPLRKWGNAITIFKFWE